MEIHKKQLSLILSNDTITKNEAALQRIKPNTRAHFFDFRKIGRDKIGAFIETANNVAKGKPN